MLHALIWPSVALLRKPVSTACKYHFPFGFLPTQDVRSPATVETSTFRIDLAAGVVSRDGRQVRLTPTEYHLLEVLARNLGRLVPQQQLLTEVWGPGYEKETHYLRVYVGQLRRKLEIDPAAPTHIITEPGLGYRLEA